MEAGAEAFGGQAVWPLERVWGKVWGSYLMPVVPSLGWHSSGCGTGEWELGLPAAPALPCTILGRPQPPWALGAHLKSSDSDGSLVGMQRGSNVSVLQMDMNYNKGKVVILSLDCDPGSSWEVLGAGIVWVGLSVSPLGNVPPCWEGYANRPCISFDLPAAGSQ